MAKIIFRCNYIKGSSKRHKDNYIKYIATRENVEKTISIEKLKEKKENYIDYLGNRPRVAKIGEHGLFSNEGEEVNLNRVAEEVAEHKGTIWTNVISIRREDAQRLGYDSVMEWQSLVRSKVGELSEAFKIKPENLKWYAAFHNESHHPHIHLVVYSKNESEGFIGKSGIEKLRRSFAHDIFRQDFANIYAEESKARDMLKNQSYIKMQKIIEQIKSRTVTNRSIEKDLFLLSDRLSKTKGKKVYGYLKKDVKNIVDNIVEKLAEDELVAELYNEWYKSTNEILKVYAENIPEKVPLSERKEFKSIKNMIINEALKLDISQIECPNIDSNVEIDVPEYNEEVKEQKDKGKTCWSKEFDKAVKMLRENPFDEKAVELMIKEAERGNALAMYELGRIYNSDKAVSKDDEKAQEWYKKSLETFLLMDAEKIVPYMAYRIGKMYVNGLGTEQDYSEGMKWLKKAEEKHIYARYLLGVMYQRGMGVEPDIETAIEYYMESSSIPYASYEVARYLEKKSPERKEAIKSYYATAYYGFLSINEKIQPDDILKATLEYKLGRMSYYGLGTEANTKQAIEYLTEASNKGHQYAQFLLGIIYLKEKEIRDIDMCLKWLTLSAEQGNESAKELIEKIKESQARYLLKYIENSVTNLFRQTASIFEENIKKTYSSESNRMKLSKKRRKELQRKNKNVKEYEETLTMGGDSDVIY